MVNLVHTLVTYVFLCELLWMGDSCEISRAEKKIQDIEIERFWQHQQKCKVQRDTEEKMFLTSMNEKVSSH